jgi:hypothetical protein
MNLLSAAAATLKSKRFWLWQIAGVIIYAIPVAIRFVTKSVAIPILNFPGFWIGYFIPGNFLEKLLVNSFFPGGAGGIAGEIFFNNYQGSVAKGKTKHLHRLAGALLETAAWSAFQFAGYYLLIMGPYGSNIFEHALVFPINFALAALSVFTPDVVGFVKTKLSKTRKASSNL